MPTPHFRAEAQRIEGLHRQIDNLQGDVADRERAIEDVSQRWRNAEQQVEQRNTRIFQLEAALRAVTLVAGNLTDEAVEAVGGINDARSRALMVVNARTIARLALNPPGEE